MTTTQPYPEALITPGPFPWSYNDPLFGTKVTKASEASTTPNIDGRGGMAPWIMTEYSTDIFSNK